MQYKNIFLFTVFLINNSLIHSVNPKFKVIEERLSKGEITKTIPMREFLNQKGHIANFGSSSVLYIELKDGLKAVFRPIEDEKRTREAEIFAYRFSQWLDLDIVPPVVFRTIEGKEGILQRYISPEIDLNEEGVYDKALMHISPQELSNIKVFFFIIGQFDTGPHNMLIHKKKNGKQYPWLFDFETIANIQKVKYGEFSFVKVEYIDEESADQFDFIGSVFDPQKDKELPQFKQYLELPMIKKAFLRNNLKKSYSIWNNGFYIQYHRYDDSILYSPSFTETYDLKTIEKLKTLDDKNLNSLLIDLKAPFFTRTDWRNKDVSIWKNDFLERNAQLLDHAKTKGKFF